MAARRLIIILVVLLAISIAAAAVAPERRSRLASLPEETSTTESAGRPLPSGSLVTSELEASPEEPQTIRAEIGDRLALSVASQRTREVEIPSLGLLEDAARGAPARFDLLLREPGTLPITDSESGSVIGRIVVEADGPAPGPDTQASPGDAGGQGGSPASAAGAEQV